LIINACKNSGKNESQGNAVLDTITRKAPSDSLVNPSISQFNNQSDSLIVAIQKARKMYVGDFDTMLNRRIIRVGVPYSRTLFFNDKGRERGISADNFREFEGFVTRKYAKKLHNIPITVVFIPTVRDELIPSIVRGATDIAAGNLTVTEERLRQVDFFAPEDLTNVSEIVLTRKRDTLITNLEQLSGVTVSVRRSSSYFGSLQMLNKMFRDRGRTLIKLQVVSEYLEDEDLMEMLDAGIIKAIVVDDWKAKMWAQIFPNIVLNDGAPVHRGGHIGWAFRKNSPLLTAEFKDYYYKIEKHNESLLYRFRSYNRQVRYLQDPTKSDNVKRYNEIIKLFEKFGKEYSFDPLMLAAMGFQESALNQKERSPVGAIGVMQVMPGTGTQMKVGDITITEPNIHAGTKYMYQIMSKNFKDAHFDEFNRSLFAFASYNAGPGKIDHLRKIAADRGLNPDVWINNVEIVASEKIGRETTTYVRNIIKYYYSYKLMLGMDEEERKQRDAF
jgi:membrane-bound lytic murein transglycosylase MltF